MFSKFFIERPIFATVVSLIIVIAGLVSMKALPVAQYPDHHAGADPGDHHLSGRRLENGRRFGCSAHRSSDQWRRQHALYDLDELQHRPDDHTVYFTLDTDPDIAQVQVQNRVNLAMPQLPDRGEAVRRLGAEKIIQHLMIIAVYGQGWPIQP